MISKYRYPGEIISLLFSTTIAFIVIITILDVSLLLLILLIIGQLFYVVINQKQIQGNSILVSNNQYQEIDNIIKKLCNRLKIDYPNCYITFDPYINAYVMGFKKPYVLVLTTALVETMSNAELEFVIGHELGHIKFNHAKLKSLVTPLDRNIPVITMIFNLWLRKTEYTADRIGVYLTNNAKVSTNALLKLTVGSKLSNEIKVENLVDQIKNSYDDFLEKIGELFLTHPYITNRIQKMIEFYNFQIKDNDINSV